MRIDPWSKVGIEDYSKIMKEFGVEELDNLYKKLPIQHYYFKRGIIFGHKDFEKIVRAVNKEERFVMLTGLMPSGKFHLGHKVVVDEMVYFQKLGAECYVVAADIEAYLTRNMKREELRRIAIDEYFVNYVALGLKRKKTRFYFQSSGQREYMNLSKYIAKKITFNELKSIYGDLTPGKIISVLTQVADILHPQLKENGGPRPVIVPVGVDQLPHINLSRDIAYRMRDEYKFVLPCSIFHKLVPGLSGGKMSSSDMRSAVFLSDSAEQVEEKIKKYAFSGGQATIREHREKGGNPDIDVSYQWLVFLEEDDNKLRRIYEDYKSGSLLSSELKEILIKKLNKFLKEHRKKREKAEKIVDKFIFE